MNVLKIRSYQDDVVSPLLVVSNRSRLEIGELARVENYPFFSVRIGSPSGIPVLLTAGIHGDEPAGVQAIMKFMDGPIERFLTDFNFHIYPCINPWGYEFSQRKNSKGYDLNRAISDVDGRIEMTTLLESIKNGPSRFELSIDLHEDNPTTACDVSGSEPSPGAFYMYESCFGGTLRLSESILRGLRERGVAVATQPTIYGDLNSGGVVRYGEGSSNSSFIGINELNTWLVRNKTSLALIFETHSEDSMEERVNAHLIAIEETLNACKRRQDEIFLGGGL